MLCGTQEKYSVRLIAPVPFVPSLEKEGDDDMQEHEYGIIGGAQGETIYEDM
jgi:hypothetical protein